MCLVKYNNLYSVFLTFNKLSYIAKLHRYGTDEIVFTVEICFNYVAVRQQFKGFTLQFNIFVYILLNKECAFNVNTIYKTEPVVSLRTWHGLSTFGWKNAIWMSSTTKKLYSKYYYIYCSKTSLVLNSREIRCSRGQDD